jgi:ankyrin repeat protein
MMCDSLDRGEMDQYRDSQGYNPLMLAAKTGLHDVTNYLTLRGSDMN